MAAEGPDNSPDQSPVAKRPLRRFVVAVSVLVVLAAATKAAFDYFAADLFAVAARQAAARAGLEIEFAREPVAGLLGFEVGAVTVRSASGEEVLRAAAVSGQASFVAHRPFVGVWVHIEGARATLVPSGASSEASADGDADAPALALPMLPAVLSGLTLSDASLDLGQAGRLEGDVEVEGDGAGGIRLTIEDLGYVEDSGQWAAEKISGAVRLQASSATASAGSSADPAAEGLDFEVVVESGAMLAGAVLVDFSSNPARASGRLDVLAPQAAAKRSGSAGWSVAGAEFSLGKLFRVRGDATLAGDASVKTADVVIESDNLGPAWEALVRDPFAGVAPALVDSAVEGRGKVTLGIRGVSRHAVHATATLTLRSLRTRSLEADSLTVDLPWTGASVRGAAARTGTLRAGTLSIAGLPWKGVEAKWTARPGRLEAPGAQEWKTAGATLKVSGLLLEDDPRLGPRLSADLELVDVDVARVAEAAGFPSVPGRMRGRLGTLRLDADALRVDGGLELEVFGGVVRLSKLFVDAPFSRVPEFGLDAAVEDLDLGQLASQLGVGEVRGVLEGEVRGLVMAAGQPVAFDADLHTVKRRGVSQSIGVRAIVQLGVLGGGDSGSITGRLLKMIDRYRYSALGIRCRLRNDVFEVRGVETDDGKDYIVKGSLLPPSVSVVSHSQVVSFSEMLRRIRRITEMGTAE